MLRDDNNCSQKAQAGPLNDNNVTNLCVICIPELIFSHTSSGFWIPPATKLLNGFLTSTPPFLSVHLQQHNCIHLIQASLKSSSSLCIDLSYVFQAFFASSRVLTLVSTSKSQVGPGKFPKRNNCGLYGCAKMIL